MERLIIKVRCPWCSTEFNTSKIRTVTCPNCKKRFHVYYRRHGKIAHFIVDIVKGTKNQLFKAYSRIFKRPITI
jgi:DNA-directed RNA polymerase subunit RPC12/RpoP